MENLNLFYKGVLANHMIYYKASVQSIMLHISVRGVKVRHHKPRLLKIKWHGTEWKVMVSSVRTCDTECGLVAFGQQYWWLNLRRESSTYLLDTFARSSITVSHSGNIRREEELHHHWTLQMSGSNCKNIDDPIKYISKSR